MGIPFSVVDHLIDEFGPDLEKKFLTRKTCVRELRLVSKRCRRPTEVDFDAVTRKVFHILAQVNWTGLSGGTGTFDSCPECLSLIDCSSHLEGGVCPWRLRQYRLSNPPPEPAQQ